MAANEARGNDVQAVQVGRVLGKSREEILADRETTRAESIAKTEGTTRNVRQDNARVGRQADVIHGNVTVTW